MFTTTEKFTSQVTISSFLVVFLFLFFEKKRNSFFLSWHFQALLLRNYVKYCKIARIIDKIYNFSGFFTIQYINLILSQNVILFHESCLKNPEIWKGIIMKNVANVHAILLRKITGTHHTLFLFFFILTSGYLCYTAFTYNI